MLSPSPGPLTPVPPAPPPLVSQEETAKAIPSATQAVARRRFELRDAASIALIVIEHLFVCLAERQCVTPSMTLGIRVR
jgi:hypothetical protein